MRNGNGRKACVGGWASAAGVAAVVALAGSAQAQCRVLSANMPDLDQRRTALGGNGSWFCLPTAACNVLAYFQNTSTAATNVFGGIPRDWSGQTWYDLASSRIAEMGVLMQTDPNGGTCCGHGIEGIESWLETYAPDEFTVAGLFPSSTFTPSIDQLKRGRGTFGQETQINVVWYSTETSGRHYATGGHMVTLRWFDPCNNEVGIRDPWTSADESMTAQSPFTVTPTGVVPVAGIFDNQSYTLSKIPGYDTDAYWFATVVMGRKFCWATDIVLTVPKIKLLIPGVPEIYGINEAQVFSAPAGQIAVTSIVPTADLQGAYVTTRASGLAGAQVLWHFDPSLNKWTQIAGVTMPLASDSDAVIEVDRFNHLYVAGGKILRRYSMGLGGKTPVELASLNLGNRIGDIVMGDGSVRPALGSTKIWALQPEGGKLAEIESDLSSMSNRTLPVAVAADASISVHPKTNEMFLAAGTGGGVHRLFKSAAAAVWGITETLSNTAILNPTALEVLPSGSVMFKSRGSSVVLSKVGSAWKRSSGSPWDGLSFAGDFRIGRSRTNFTPGEHDVPGLAEIAPVRRTATFAEDCGPDVNGDGFANGDDFDLFVDWFVAGARLADFNQDGFVNGDDYDAYVAAFEAGC